MYRWLQRLNRVKHESACLCLESIEFTNLTQSETNDRVCSTQAEESCISVAEGVGDACDPITGAGVGDSCRAEGRLS